MNFFIVQSSSLLCFYYGADKSIYTRKYQNGKWSRAVCVISDARPRYSVINENALCLICQETGGNIVLCRCMEDYWQNSVILEGKGLAPPDMRMVKTGDTIIFTLPNGREQTLVMQKQKEGKWERSVMIDGFVPFNDCVYRTLRLDGGKLMLVYKKNDAKQQLGFRIIDKNGNIGDFRKIYAANGLMTDCSFVQDGREIYFALAVKGSITSRLVYVSADEEKVKNTNVLWESNNIDLVSIKKHNAGLCVNHSSGGRLYTFEKGENGFKGTDVKRMNTALKKAYIINCAGLNDIIVPKDRPYDVDITVFEK